MNYEHFFKQHTQPPHTKRGDEVTCRCPFTDHEHDGTSPAFSFNVRKGVYKCLKCGKGGNVFTFCKEKRIPVPPEYQDGGGDEIVRTYLNARGIEDWLVEELIEKRRLIGYTKDGEPWVKTPLMNLVTKSSEKEGNDQAWLVKSDGSRKQAKKGTKATECFFLYGNNHSPDRIFVTEGIENAQTLYQVFPRSQVVSIMGAGMTGKLEHLKPDAEKVVLFFDNDEAGRRATMEALKILPKAKAVHWDGVYDEGYDPNDFLRDGKTEELKRMVEGAGTIPGEEHEERIDLFENGVLYREWRGKNEIVQIDAEKLAERMIEKYHLKVPGDRSIYRWNGSHYEPVDDADLNTLCYEELDGLCQLTKNHIPHIHHFIVQKANVKLNGEEERARRFIPFQNVLYDTERDEVIPLSADHFVTDLLPTEYQEDATCPFFLQVLDGIFEGDRETVGTLQEAFGYTLHREAPLPEPLAFIFWGNGSNGKSVVQWVLRQVLGEENCASLDVKGFSNRQSLFNLYRKFANVVDEMPKTSVVSSEPFRKVVSGENVQVKKLYKDEFSTNLHAKHFFSTNKLPKVKDQGHYVWRRLVLIPFPHQFEREKDLIPTHVLKQELKREMPGITRWVVDGFRRLRGNDFVLTVSPSCERHLKDFQLRSTTTMWFLERRAKKVPGAHWNFGEWYNRYTYFCESEDVDYLSEVKAGRELRENGVVVERWGDGGSTHVFGYEPKQVDELQAE